jgi:hypothetical protein
MEHNKDFLDLALDVENITDIELKKFVQSELKNSLFPEWENFNQSKIIINQNPNTNPNKPTQSNFIKSISEGIINSNQLNDYVQDLNFDLNFYNLLDELNKNGVSFDTKFNLNYTIRINSGEIVFPICCVGKNRSQYLFYYLKNLQSIDGKNFIIGYPSSGDELSVITDYLNSNLNLNLDLNKNVLSSYSTQYKKDSFSNSISKSFEITNPDNLCDIPRSIHIFDKILKNKTPYGNSDLKNFEYFKYNTNKYDIFDKNNYKTYEKIIQLYIKYFFTPTNLLNLVNFDIPYKMNKITYICMSDKSFYNICLCFNAIKKSFPQIDLNNIRIVYFGIQDIFQRSNIKESVICDLKSKFTNSIDFVLD